MPPLPGWLTHSASFCLGAAATASAWILLLRSSESRPARIAEGADGERREGEDVASASISRRTTAATMKTATAIGTMLPSPPVRIFAPNDDLAIAFDGRTKNPVYVVERLVPPDATARLDRTSSSSSSSSSSSRPRLRDGLRFREEKSLSPYHRSRNSHYRHSGYDRGHLAPAADFARGYDDDDENDDENDDRRRTRMDDTFALTNVSPQVPRFNRSIWLRLEEFVRREAGKGLAGGGAADGVGRGVETWVVTGPLWLPRIAPLARGGVVAGGESNGEGRVFRYSYEGIGRPPSLVAVPTHFYKVVVVVDDGASTVGKNDSVDATSSGSSSEVKGGDPDATTAASLRRFAAFVLPNSDLGGGGGGGDDDAPRGIRLADHVVRLTDLETVTGIEFFPALFGTYVDDGTDDVPIRKEIADALTDEIILNRGGRNGGEGGSGWVVDDRSNALVPLSNKEGSSVERQRKMRRALRDNSLIQFQHMCRNNDDCYKFLRV